MQIVPTLLTTTIDEFKNQLNIFQPLFNRIQLDIADMTIVKNQTTKISQILELSKNNEIRFDKNVVYDFHLMVSDYVEALKNIEELSKETDINVGTVLINASLYEDDLYIKKFKFFKIGVDIFPQMSINEVASKFDLKNYPAIQIMTVSPGFQGSPFLPEMLEKIEELRSLGFLGEILIDGGVNDKTIPIIRSKKQKPDILCIGSYLTKANNINELSIIKNRLIASI